MPRKKLRLIQRLTDEFFRLRSKVLRDPRTNEQLLVRNRFRRIENIMRKRYGDIYALALINMGTTIIDEKGEEHDLLQLQRKWIC